MDCRQLQRLNLSRWWNTHQVDLRRRTPRANPRSKALPFFWVTWTDKLLFSELLIARMSSLTVSTEKPTYPHGIYQFICSQPSLFSKQCRVPMFR